MKDLLTPGAVKNWMKSPLGIVIDRASLSRLGQDYLTLWDELANERSISDRLLERVAELERANVMALQIVEATRKLAEDNEMEEQS